MGKSLGANVGVKRVTKAQMLRLGMNPYAEACLGNERKDARDSPETRDVLFVTHLERSANRLSSP